VTAPTRRVEIAIGVRDVNPSLTEFTKTPFFLNAFAKFRTNARRHPP
jgi:hypothetical protein